jgi:hypothetical protein
MRWEDKQMMVVSYISGVPRDLVRNKMWGPARHQRKLLTLAVEQTNKKGWRGAD